MKVAGALRAFAARLDGEGRRADIEAHIDRIVAVGHRRQLKAEHAPVSDIATANTVLGILARALDRPEKVRPLRAWDRPDRDVQTESNARRPDV